MARNTDWYLTALAPAIWGSTYLVTTEFLPGGYPLTVAMLRALPAGLVMLLIAKSLPTRAWYGRVFLLGALNFSIFWALLFIAAYRLPGGIAATVGAVQPLIVVLFARYWMASPITLLSIIAALLGIGGVALLILTPNTPLDPIGISAALGGAISMAAGTVLSRKWQPPVSLATFTAWQLTAGGILLMPFAFLLEPSLPTLSIGNMAGLIYLSLIGAALTYFLWFRGLSLMHPSAVATLGFLSPVTAVLLGWLALGQHVTTWEILGIFTVLASVWLGLQANHSGKAVLTKTINKPLKPETIQ